MKVSILCSSETHPVNIYLRKWIDENFLRHDISLFRKKVELTGGDLLFLISCHEIINKSDRDKFNHALVIHASDLPKGRGWSPHIWEIINGNQEITLSLIDATDKLDNGNVWKKIKITIPEHLLYDEINDLIFDGELSLMTYAIENYKTIKPKPQDVTNESSYYRQRKPEDSEINPEKSITEQFNKLRVCDPTRFPAFIMHGHKYILKIEKILHEDDFNK